MISVVIPNRNGRAHLETCLPALQRQQIDAAFEIIVVDNGSEDDSRAFLHDRFPGVRVVALEDNHGFAGGCNRGAREGCGEFLAFLNNDTEPNLDWLARLYHALQVRTDVDLATSQILFFDGRTIDSAGDGYLRCGGAFKRHHGDLVGASQGTDEVFGACGAAFMIRRALFDALGGFDEDFFLVYEDVDLSYRARLRGSTCMLVPDAIVLHKGSASLGRGSSTAMFYGQRNLEWTYVKNTPAVLLCRTLPAHVAYGLAAGVVYALRGDGLLFLRAKRAAFAGLPRILRKRRQIQRSRRVPIGALLARMDTGWIGRKWREKRFMLWQ